MTTSLPVVSLKGITRCQSQNSKSWLCLTVCVQGLCLQSSPKLLLVVALSALVPGLGEVLNSSACPMQEKKKKKNKNPCHEHFVSKRTELCLLLAVLWFSCMWRWPGFPNACPLPSREPDFVLAFLPASNPLELRRVWATLQLLAVYLISGEAVELEPGLLSAVLLSPWTSQSLSPPRHA